LIHNPQTVATLLQRYNVTPVSELHCARGGLVIVRTHGVSPRVYRQAEAEGIELLDATCPFVLRVQRQARELAEDGYTVVVLGESHHPEVEAVLAHAGGRAAVVSGPQDLPGTLGSKVGLVVQTTQEPATLARVAARLVVRCEELRVHNTICQATKRRQAAALDVASRSDLMIVVGGKDSANTRRLWQICARRGKPCYHIEVTEELDPQWLVGIDRVGITGGASTPKAEIRKVAQAVAALERPDR
jgi:4-hydroxy-3-methylbut-2-enyl diphosphate reductase